MVVRKGPQLWWAPIDGRALRKLDVDIDLAKVSILEFTVHPDGRRVAFTQRETRTGPQFSQLWVLENFLPGTSLKP
jgi:hypothetical protein